MTVVDTDFVHRSFDPNDATQLQDPYPIYRELRDAGVVWSDKHEGGFAVVSRYRDVYRVARDPETFSSAGGINLPAVGSQRPMLPIEADPPEHHAYRRPLAPVFAPPVVDRIEPELRQLAVEIIDGIAARGKCEFITDFAYLFPMMAVYRSPWMGDFLPGEKLDPQGVDDIPANFRDAVQAFIHDVGPTSERIGACIYEYTEKMIAHRSGCPMDDLPSRILGAKFLDRDFTHQEIVDLLFLQFVAGPPTVGAALGGFFWFLAQRPDVCKRLVAEPELMDSAVEELLRFLGPTQAERRTTTREVELGGLTLPPQTPVLVVWAAANRDEAEFPNGEEFVIDRFPNRHLAFGAGVHRCIGSNVARTLIRISIEEWLRRIPDFGIEEGATLEWDVGVSRSLKQLPLVW